MRGHLNFLLTYFPRVAVVSSLSLYLQPAIWTEYGKSQAYKSTVIQIMKFLCDVRELITDGTFFAPSTFFEPLLWRMQPRYNDASALYMNSLPTHLWPIWEAIASSPAYSALAAETVNEFVPILKNDPFLRQSVGIKNTVGEKNISAIKRFVQHADL
jgi:hypothetical protein